MQKDYIEQANAVDGAFNGHPQHKYDPFSNSTILDGEITRTYVIRTYLNKAIKLDSSTPMNFSRSRIIKQDSPLHLQIPMLWGHRVMIVMR
jgi:hypothetical protein